ncbi:MAG: ribonuclease H-like domain-containing protein [bacterium]|nr:MAG: ribonuclease H-like domain-containing protein [bacterium]
MKAYLDIETTYDGQISVVGIHIPGRDIVQLTGGEVTDLNLSRALDGVETLVTFNGACFDLPVIRRVTGLDLCDITSHRDLLAVCRGRGIRGGLKRVEALFGIQRTAGVVDGKYAPHLWHRWETAADEEALGQLLADHRDDCVNLEILENILDGLEGEES